MMKAAWLRLCLQRKSGLMVGQPLLPFLRCSHADLVEKQDRTFCNRVNPRDGHEAVVEMVR